MSYVLLVLFVPVMLLAIIIVLDKYHVTQRWDDPARDKEPETPEESARAAKAQAAKGQRWTWISLLIVVTLWGAWFLWGWTPKDQTLAEHGDWFGSLNALFTGIALGGVALTAYMQSRELKMQAEELRNSVKAQEELVDEQKADRRTQQAMRLLDAYSEWISEFNFLREHFGPAPAVAGVKSQKQDYFDSCRSMLKDVARITQRLVLIDPKFPRVTAPRSAWLEHVKGAESKTPPSREEADAYELMRAAVYSVEIRPVVGDRLRNMPGLEDLASQVEFHISLHALRLADMAINLANVDVARAHDELMRFVTLHASMEASVAMQADLTVERD